jgi:hypothetical protein
VDEHEPAAIGRHTALPDGHPVVGQSEQVSGRAGAQVVALGEVAVEPDDPIARNIERAQVITDPESQHQGRHHVSDDVAWLSCVLSPVHRSTRCSWTVPSTARWWMSQRPSCVIVGT